MLVWEALSSESVALGSSVPEQPFLPAPGWISGGNPPPPPPPLAPHLPPVRGSGLPCRAAPLGPCCCPAGLSGAAWSVQPVISRLINSTAPLPEGQAHSYPFSVICSTSTEPASAPGTVLHTWDKVGGSHGPSFLVWELEKRLRPTSWTGQTHLSEPLQDTTQELRDPPHPRTAL